MSRLIRNALYSLLPVLFVISCSDGVLLQSLTALQEERENPTPLIVSVSPVPEQTEETVLIFNQDIVIVFSQSMDPDSLVLAGTMADECAAGLFSSSVGLEDSVLTLSPVDYWHTGTKNLEISCQSRGGKDLYIDGETTSLSLSFLISPPEIRTFTPSAEDDAVINRDCVFTIDFQQDMDESSLTLSGALGNEAASALWTHPQEDIHRLTISPFTEWTTGEGRELIIDVREDGGNPVETFSRTYAVLNNAIHVSPTSDGGSSSNSGTTVSPLSDIQSAINRAEVLFPGGGEVRVAEGDYLVNSENAIIVIPGLSLRGSYSTDFSGRDFATPSVIKEGRITGACSTVSAVEEMDASTEIEGFTIIGGQGTGLQNTLIDLRSGASPAIRKNTFTVEASPGSETYLTGISVTGGDSAPVIDSNEFLYESISVHSFTALSLSGNGMTEIRNNKLSFEAERSSALLISTGSAHFRNNSLYNGYIYLIGDSTLACDNNIFEASGSSLLAAINFSTGATAPVSVMKNAFFNWQNLYNEIDGSTIIRSETTVPALETLLGSGASGNVEADPVFDSNLDLTGTTPAAVYAGGIDGTEEGWGYSLDINGNVRTGASRTGWSMGAVELDI